MEGLTLIQLENQKYKLNDTFYVKVKGEITPEEVLIHYGGNIQILS